MTELSFLVDLLLNHKLPKATQQAVAARIKEVEEALAQAPPAPAIVRSPLPMPRPVAGIVQQAASTIAALAKHPDLAEQMGIDISVVPPPPAPIPEPPAVVAQTMAAAMAMQSRQQAISESIKGTVNKETGRPRKF